ncbi:MAG: hypothetical protein C0453_04020 [Comamonadaceae bacterium]|nr:hypothetical protein [Comamonadaceae bacterium]
MPKNSAVTPQWTTSSFGHPAEWLSSERSELSAHLAQCGAQRRPLHVLRSGADRLQGVLVSRVVTSAVVLGVLIGGSWLAL